MDYCKGQDYCKVCHRLHDEDMPCPRRVANAYQMQPLALVRLTEADKKWMADNDIVSILEEELANRMS